MDNKRWLDERGSANIERSSMTTSMTSFLLEPTSARPGLLVAIHNANEPSASEWSAWCELCELAFSMVKGELSQMPALVMSDGGTPSIQQRNRAAALVFDGRTTPRVAIVTQSTTVRLLAPVLGALMPGVRAFAPASIADALEFCRWSRADTDEVLAQIEGRAERAFGPNAIKCVINARAALART